MAVAGEIGSMEVQIGKWRDYLRRKRAISEADVDELETHLRDQLASLQAQGLAEEEAFLVAVRRMGNLDDLSREFAREHSDRLWKQLVVAPTDRGSDSDSARTELGVVIGLAATAAMAIKVPELFGQPFTELEQSIYARNLSFFVLPALTLYFAWKRRLSGRILGALMLTFAVAALLINLSPMQQGGQTESLAALHLPIALWLVVGIAYVGGRWFGDDGRMNFVRFSGELFIYYVLLALGGGVLTLFTLTMFEAIGLDAEGFLQRWLLPCGAMGAVIVAAWLVEAKQSVIENMAPVLTRIFTPLFAAALLAFLVAMLVTGRGIDIERNVLIGFDLLLVVILALLLYSISARDPLAPPSFFDWLQLSLVLTALAVDLLALGAIAARISEFGFTPNRVAALGENLVLLVNLAYSAWLYLRFAQGKKPFAALERWQMAYLAVFAAWAAIVVVILPPLFGYV